VTTNTVLVLQVIISAGGVIASITVSSFVSGTRWGRMETDMRAMADRLAKIEGMFTLRLKDNSEDPRSRQ
jgi:hypothetical protein